VKGIPVRFTGVLFVFLEVKKLMNDYLIKYPRTPHLEGSRLQPGDEDLSQVRFLEIRGRHLAVEEKCDGANSAISFTKDGELLLQSRGHYLTGGYRERHYNLMKQWANVHKDAFYEALGARYIMYGEWMYAKHSVFYDRLPHYFLEFDILDRENGKFLDTPSRRKITKGLPIVSVPVLKEGRFSDHKELLSLIGKSNFISSGQRDVFKELCARDGLDVERQCEETDLSEMMEGLYIKVEEGGFVTGRLKYVRNSFAQCIINSGTHWLERPIIVNQLACPVENLYLPALLEEGE